MLSISRTLYILVLHLLMFLMLLQLTLAHTVFTTLFVNDVDQGDGTCVRMPANPANCTFPLRDLASNDMACGYNGEVGVARVCPAPAGAKLTFTFRTWPDASQPGSIDISHKGPMAVYMKSVKSAVDDQGYGNGWFKIWEMGYDADTFKWATEKLIENSGMLSIDTPSDLAGGYYLVRPEILALHQADKSPPDPQFYLGCAQIFLQSSNIAHPEQTVSIPGYINAGDPSTLFNIYQPQWPYPMPGPPVYEASSSSIHTAEHIAVVQSQQEGLVPNHCVVQNANWCGIELDAYSTEAGCWNASKACFSQATDCYDSAPATGARGCRVWETKCTAIQAGCNDANYNGAPDRDQGLYSANSRPSTVSAAWTDLVYASSSVLSAASSTSSWTTASISEDGSCGEFSNKRCTDSIFGDCCSQHGFCGSTEAYCSAGCNPGYGTCDSYVRRDMSVDVPKVYSLVSMATDSAQSPQSTTAVSADGLCGMQTLLTGYTCHGRQSGQCCSIWGYCGDTDDYCGDGCQDGFGICNDLYVRHTTEETSSTNNNKNKDKQYVSTLPSIALNDTSSASRMVSATAESQTVGATSKVVTTAKASGIPLQSRIAHHKHGDHEHRQRG